MERNTSDTSGRGNTGDSTSGGFGGTSSSTAGEKLADAGTSIRDRAGSLKHSIADALESSAEKLRAQGAGGGQIAGIAATRGSADMIGEGNRLGEATNQLAGGLQASADWLRDADLDGLKSGVERQVKEHPARSLAVAIGLGYLLGKVLRK